MLLDDRSQMKEGKGKRDLFGASEPPVSSRPSMTLSQLSLPTYLHHQGTPLHAHSFNVTIGAFCSQVNGNLWQEARRSSRVPLCILSVSG